VDLRAEHTPGVGAVKTSSNVGMSSSLGLRQIGPIGRLRYVSLTVRLATARREHRHLRSDRVLCLPDGSPMSADIVKHHVERAARRAHIGQSGVHRFRHTFCSHLAMRGAPARAIQELAGYRDRSTTQRHKHLSPAAIAGAIRGGCEVGSSRRPRPESPPSRLRRYGATAFVDGACQAEVRVASHANEGWRGVWDDFRNWLSSASALGVSPQRISERDGLAKAKPADGVQDSGGPGQRQLAPNRGMAQEHQQVTGGSLINRTMR